MADPTKARAAKRRYADERMIKDLHTRGWLCWKTGPKGDEAQLPDDLQVYATNFMGETYRVIDWTPTGQPILAGGWVENPDTGATERTDFVGLFDYVFTRGPK